MLIINLQRKIRGSLMNWHGPIILVLWWLRQEDCMLQASMGHLVKACLKTNSLVWWCIVIIPALGRLGWEDHCGSEASLSYMLNSRQARIPQQDPIQKQKRKEGRGGGRKEIEGEMFFISKLKLN